MLAFPILVAVKYSSKKLLQSSLKSCWDGNRLIHLFVRLFVIFPFWVLGFLYIPFYLEDSLKTESPEAHLEARIYLYVSDLLRKCSQEKSIRNWEKQEGRGSPCCICRLGLTQADPAGTYIITTQISEECNVWLDAAQFCPHLRQGTWASITPTLPVLRKGYLEWKRQTSSSLWGRAMPK